MKRYAIILGGGRGLRFEQDVPKQFHRINGVPILFYSMEAFHRAFDDVLIHLVLPKQYFDLWSQLTSEFDFNIDHELIEGGETRMESVQNALQKIGDNGLVAVHDGVRPNITDQLIQEVYKAAEAFGSAVPTIEMTDSIVLKKGDRYDPLDRTQYQLLQTPQCFDVERLKNAYSSFSGSNATDDSSVWMNSYSNVNFVAGEVANIKLTFPEQLDFFQSTSNT